MDSAKDTALRAQQVAQALGGASGGTQAIDGMAGSKPADSFEHKSGESMSSARVKLLKVLEPVMLVLVPLILVVAVYTKMQNPALLTGVVAIAASIPFFLRFELERPKPRDFMPIVVMSALGVASRVVFAPFPSFKPVAAFSIMTGISFGRQAGFLTGALIAFASNMFFGQGAWTPWQMYALGLTGYLAGVLHDVGFFKKPIVVYVYGFLASLFYMFIMDSWGIIGYVNPLTWAGALATYASGFPFACIFGAATVTFLVPLLVPWSKKFERIKRKYGIV